MERLVDMDVLADRLQTVIAEWRSRGTVAPMTWRDEAADWPQPVTSDRSSVRSPESLGLRLYSPDRENMCEVVVWAGGWADVGLLLRGEARAFCPEFRDGDGAYAAVVAAVEQFLSQSAPGAEGALP